MSVWHILLRGAPRESLSNRPLTRALSFRRGIAGLSITNNNWSQETEGHLKENIYGKGGVMGPRCPSFRLAHALIGFSTCC